MSTTFKQAATTTTFPHFAHDDYVGTVFIGANPDEHGAGDYWVTAEDGPDGRQLIIRWSNDDEENRCLPVSAVFSGLADPVTGHRFAETWREPLQRYINWRDMADFTCRELTVEPSFKSLACITISEDRDGSYGVLGYVLCVTNDVEPTNEQIGGHVEQEYPHHSNCGHSYDCCGCRTLNKGTWSRIPDSEGLIYVRRTYSRNF